MRKGNRGEWWFNGRHDLPSLSFSCSQSSSLSLPSHACYSVLKLRLLYRGNPACSTEGYYPLCAMQLLRTLACLLTVVRRLYAASGRTERIDSQVLEREYRQQSGEYLTHPIACLQLYTIVAIMTVYVTLISV